MSGALNMLKEIPSMASAAASINLAAEYLVMACGDLYKGGKANPKYAESDIAEINDKLDRLTRLLPSGAFVDASPTTALLSHDSNFPQGEDLRASASFEAEHKSKHQRDEVTLKAPFGTHAMY